MSQFATISGRIVGPDGLGRMGRITFTPTSAVGLPPDSNVLAGRVSSRIDPDGRLAGPNGPQLTLLPGRYEIDLNIPGDLGIHLRTTATLVGGQTFTLADVLAATPAPPPIPNPPSPPQPGGGILQPDGHGVRNVDASTTLEAINGAEIIDLGNGVLTWR